VSEPGNLHVLPVLGISRRGVTKVAVDADRTWWPNVAMRPAAMLTSDIVARIGDLQAVQERNPPFSMEWQLASDALQPLFREMAKRQTANGGERNWRKWK
jgi:hypothetical protein